LARLTAARAGFLDNIDNANLGTIDDISTLTAAVIAHLNVDIDSRSPANEYDIQLDANMSTRAPANEYDTEMGYITEAVATESKQDVIDGYHDVPVEDVATDAQMRDVVGKKTDTVGGTSLVSISKQVKAKTDNIPASPAPSGEYDVQLDANMSTRAPANEYDTEMGYVTEAVATEAKQDIISSKLVGGEAENTVAALNANGGTATSGDTGADVFTISATTRKKIHFLGVDISGLTADAKATIRLYTKVLNADASLTEFYEQVFTVGTDPDLVPVIDGSMGIRNDLRVEIQSDNASDTSVSVKYCYITEDME